jgi:mannan endo-1,4-beta-mannosidase
MLDGKVFRFGGANCAYVPWASPYELDQAMADAQAMHLNVVRTFASIVIGSPPGLGPDTIWNIQGHRGPGAPSQYLDVHGTYFQAWDPDAGAMLINTGAGGLAHLDALLASAASHGIRLVIAFNDNWSFTGGTPQYCAWHGMTVTDGGRWCPEFYTDTQMNAEYQTWVRAVLNRVNTLTGVAYKDDPTVLAWELMNEPAATNSVYLQWTAKMASYVKSIDTHHLVITGDVGVHDMTRFLATLAIADVDYGTLHVYPIFSQPSPTISGCGKGIRDWIAAGRDAGKPVVVEEFGIAAAEFDGGLPLQASTYAQWTQIALDAGAAGWSPWALVGRSDYTSPPDQFTPISWWDIHNDGSATASNLSAAAVQINTP